MLLTQCKYDVESKLIQTIQQAKCLSQNKYVFVAESLVLVALLEF
jgi:hypothetical protein